MTLLEALTERVLTRRAHHSRTEIVSRLPMPFEVDETQIVGVFVRIFQNTKRRMIIENEAIDFGPAEDEKADHPRLLETPSAVARDYLLETYKRGPITKAAQFSALLARVNGHPNFAKPGKFPMGWYVDIKATYWNIMRLTGWDADYWPGKFIGRGLPPTSFPFPDHKRARNCIVSVGLSDSFQMWQPDRGLFPVHRFNPLLNIGLARIISDLLNAIAQDVLSLGHVVYVNTDGYITTDEKVKDEILAVIADWGMTGSIRFTGPGWVRGPGAYKVGEHTSGARLDAPEFINQVTPPPYTRWLRQRVSWLAGFA